MTAIEQWHPREVTPHVEKTLAAQASSLARSTLVPAGLKGKPDDIMLVVVTGWTLGLPPAVSVQQIWAVEGRPYVSSDALLSLAKTLGHTIRPVELSSQQCVVRAWRRGEHPADALTVTYTLDDAVKAGLTNKPAWKLSPQSMLLHRATRLAVKAVCPEVTTGIAGLGLDIADTGEDDIQPPEADPEPAAEHADPWPQQWADRVKKLGYGPKESRLIITRALGRPTPAADVRGEERRRCEALITELEQGTKRIAGLEIVPTAPPVPVTVTTNDYPTDDPERPFDEDSQS